MSVTNTSIEHLQPRHFLLEWAVSGNVAYITLNRPLRKNPLTFDVYAELLAFFRQIAAQPALRTVVLRGAGGDFCSGGDLHEIIGPLLRMTATEQLAFTRMTGALVKAMRDCPQLILSAIEGVCAGAGAMLALASDLRIAGAGAQIAFLFTRVGLAGCDMGACTLLPRMVGQGRAAELLLTGRAMSAEEALACGFLNRLTPQGHAAAEAQSWAHELAQGPALALSMTKNMLNQEWNMGLEQALEAEAQAQALCMQTKDFQRAYEAFVAKQTPRFEGN